MSTADLAAPPPIKEEPEPTTPVKGLDEKGKAVQETAVSEKDAETFPKSEEAGAYQCRVFSTCFPCVFHTISMLLLITF